jgi:LysM repeat protein/PBP1b-binding outer membrane lipoprotein LpoB
MNYTYFRFTPLWRITRMRLQMSPKWNKGLIASLLILLLAAGCYQPTGSVLEATNVGQGFPTFTDIPTQTPEPTATPFESEVTEEPTATPTPTETVDTELIAAETLVAALQEDPFAQTATMFAVQQTEVFLLEQGAVDDFPVDPPIEELNPLFLTATQMIFEATQTYSVPLTLTAQAEFFPTPTETPFIIEPTQGVQPPIISGQDCVHEVRRQDRNLFRISLAYGLTVTEIANYNNLLNPALISIGQRLIIPGCGTLGFIPPPTSTPGYTGVPPVIPGDRTCTSPWIVEQGDTLFRISIACNRTIRELQNINSIVDPNLIFINDSLTIP